MTFVFIKEKQNLKMLFAANLGGPLLAWHYEQIQTYTHFDIHYSYIYFNIVI